jgi:hypothetical protein
VSKARNAGKSSFVSLTILMGSFKQTGAGDTFRCDCGDGKIIQCAIADIALRDLVDYHRTNKTAADVSQVLLAEIERIANAKFNAGRFEEDGSLVIRAADIVRFGFQVRKKRAA